MFHCLSLEVMCVGLFVCLFTFSLQLMYGQLEEADTLIEVLCKEKVGHMTALTTW